jgi:hypothetical protein
MNIYISGEIPSKEHANNMNEEENDDEIERFVPAFQVIKMKYLKFYSMGNEQREILDEENSFKHRKIENKTLSVDQFISRRLARRRKKLLSVYPLSLTLGIVENEHNLGRSHPLQGGSNFL